MFHCPDLEVSVEIALLVNLYPVTLGGTGPVRNEMADGPFIMQIVLALYCSLIFLFS